jgi:hypothetical protein
MHAAIRLTPLILLIASCNSVDGPDGEGVVWTGFNYSWDLLSHRIALNEVTVEEDGSLSLALIGGDWSTGSTFSDVPTYRVRYQNVSSRGLIVEHGATELLLGPDGEATVSASITNGEILDMENAIVVLRGYRIDTDIEQSADYPEDYDPALGYTSRGFGFSLSELDDTGAFDVTAALRWGPQDREDMNGAIPYAQSAVVVSWTAIGFSGELTGESISATVDYAWDPPYTEHEPLGESDLPISLGGDVGFLGLRSFDLLIVDQDGSDGGCYLRRFGLEAVQDSTGQPQYAIADGTNSSAFEEIALTFTASADLIWASLADRDAVVEVVEMEGTHDVGEATVAAP